MEKDFENFVIKRIADGVVINRIRAPKGTVVFNLDEGCEIAPDDGTSVGEVYKGVG